MTEKNRFQGFLAAQRTGATVARSGLGREMTRTLAKLGHSGSARLD
jgi:hypothetical protein